MFRNRPEPQEGSRRSRNQDFTSWLKMLLIKLPKSSMMLGILPLEHNVFRGALTFLSQLIPGLNVMV